MASACPAPDPSDPLVRGLLGVVDCNTQALVHGGYAMLFQPSSPFTGVLTALLTIYVAVVGYQLLLGRSQLMVSDFALTAVKLGAVLALATQWDVYQAVVYRFLFEGPQELASGMLATVRPDDAAFGGNVFDGLQRAFDDLSGFAGGYASQSPPQTSPLLGGAGFGALMLNSSATILLLSSLGVLLVSKIVLGLLLAVGPVFIALLLFDSTRGLFEGWLRAAIAFAFAPFASILLLGVALTMLEPSLLQMEALKRQGVFQLQPVYSIATLVLVFAGVSAAAIIAGGVVAAGFKLPVRRVVPRAAQPIGEPARNVSVSANQTRADRVAAAATALERRDSQFLSQPTYAIGASDRRMEIINTRTDRRAGAPAAAAEPRLGQSLRRRVRSRTPRPTARSA